jgi:nitrate reductase NapE component
MKIAIPKTRAEIQYHLRDPLLKNSIFIMLTSISSAGFGFIFWMLAAKLYSPQDGRDRNRPHLLDGAARASVQIRA